MPGLLFLFWDVQALRCRASDLSGGKKQREKNGQQNPGCQRNRLADSVCTVGWAEYQLWIRPAAGAVRAAGPGESDAEADSGLGAAGAFLFLLWRKPEGDLPDRKPETVCAEKPGRFRERGGGKRVGKLWEGACILPPSGGVCAGIPASGEFSHLYPFKGEQLYGKLSFFRLQKRAGCERGAGGRLSGKRADDSAPGGGNRKGMEHGGRRTGAAAGDRVRRKRCAGAPEKDSHADRKAGDLFL